MSEKSSGNQIGNQLASLRERMKLTQQEVADELGIPRSAVSLIESGDRGIKIEEIKTYSDLLKVKVEKLMAPVHHTKSKQVSENQTQANTTAEEQDPEMFFPLVATILAQLEQIGVKSAPDGVTVANVLNKPISKNGGYDLCRASVQFHLDGSDPSNRQTLTNLVDAMADSWPGCRPALQIDLEGQPGHNQLNFLTMWKPE